MASKIFRTKCVLTVGENICGMFLPVSISVDTSKEGVDVVTLVCIKGKKKYMASAKLDTVKKLVYNYKMAGTTTMETDTYYESNVRYTKGFGGLGKKDKHVTISISDMHDSDFQITCDASAFDAWLRAQMRKEGYHAD